MNRNPQFTAQFGDQIPDEKRNFYSTRAIDLEIGQTLNKHLLVILTHPDNDKTTFSITSREEALNVVETLLAATNHTWPEA